MSADALWHGLTDEEHTNFVRLRSEYNADKEEGKPTMSRLDHAQYLRLNSIYRASLRADKKAGVVDGNGSDANGLDGLNGERDEEDEGPAKKKTKVTKDNKGSSTKGAHPAAKGGPSRPPKTSANNPRIRNAPNNRHQKI